MVQRTYQEYPPDKINRIWVTLMSIFNCISENHGNNDYKIPHMNKEKMERDGTLPRELQLSQEAYHCILVDNGGSDDDITVDNDEAAGTNLDGDNDDDNSSHASDWSMNTEESVIFRKVERDWEAELKAREDDSDDSDSDEEASTNSDHSLSPEDLAYYKQVEADMLKEGTL
jgi:hypothetical protein